MAFRHSFFSFLAAAVAMCSSGAVQARDVAVFELSGNIVETPMGEELSLFSVGGESLWSLMQKMDEAAADESLDGVVLMLGDVGLAYAQLEEIRDAIARMQAGGKKVYAHVDSLSTGSYALLCGCDRLSVSPTGDVWVTGLYSEQMYIRGLLDMIGVEPVFLTCGDYKSAGEMFTNTSPSEESAEMLNWLYDSMYDSVVQLIADGRGVEAEVVKGWIDQGLYSAEAALEAGLIDAVEHRRDFVAHLKEELGNNLHFDKEYGEEDPLANIDLSSPFAALELWSQILAGPPQETDDRDSIAIVYVEGAIMLGDIEASPFGALDGAFSEPIRKALEEAAEDSNVKAVVLRVDSPGGSAIASEVILNAVRYVSSRKPIIVSMGGVAGSGGYYVACRADRIFADDTTITGSIGVVSGKLATTNMFNRVGITFHGIERGEHAGMLFSGDPFSEDEKAKLQGWMDEVYGVFKGHVVEGRGDRLTQPIDDIAGGRVYTGRQALDLGLVDEIGGLKEALAYTASEVGLEDYRVRVIPKPMGLFDMLFEDLSGSTDDDQTLSTPPVQSPWQPSLIDLALPALEQLDPQRMRLVRQALIHLQTMQSERVLMTMPLLHFAN
jgi:protease-4